MDSTHLHSHTLNIFSKTIQPPGGYQPVNSKKIETTIFLDSKYLFKSIIFLSHRVSDGPLFFRVFHPGPIHIPLSNRGLKLKSSKKMLMILIFP